MAQSASLVFSLTVSIARQSTVQEFGEFAMTMVVFVLAMGMIRAAVTDTTLARVASTRVRDECFRRGSLLAICMGISATVGGLLSSNLYLLVLGCGMHGLFALDYNPRVTNTAMYRAQTAWWPSALWSSIVIAVAVVALITPIEPWAVFLAWSIGGAVLGYASASAQHYPWKPGWPRDRQATRAAGIFSLDFLAGSGSASLTSTILGAILGAPIVGALRGAGTLFGPATLIASTCRSVAIPYLIRARGPETPTAGIGPLRMKLERRAAVGAAGALTIIAIPL